MIKRRLLLMLVASFLGFLCDATVWGETLGITFPCFIFVSLGLGCYGLMLFDTRLVPAQRSRWLVIPTLYFASMASLTAWQPSSLKYNLSLAFTFLYLALFVITYLGGQLEYYCLFDYLDRFKRLILCILLRPLEFTWELIQDIYAFVQNGNDTDAASVKFTRSIGFWIFAALFGLFWITDEIYRRLFQELFKTKLPGAGETSVWGVILWSYLILGILLYAGMQSQDDNLMSDDRQRYFRRWFNYNLSTVIFSVASIPLVTFSAVRIHCLYRGGDCLNVMGFPAWMQPVYGFWALTTASVLVFLLICWLNHVTVFDPEKKWDRPIHTALNTFLFGNVAFLLWTAWDSLVLTKTYGIDAHRHILYARAGLLWLALMFAMFIAYEHFERECDFPYAALLVTTYLVGLFCFVGVIFPALLS